MDAVPIVWSLVAVGLVVLLAVLLYTVYRARKARQAVPPEPRPRRTLVIGDIHDGVTRTRHFPPPPDDEPPSGPAGPRIAA